MIVVGLNGKRFADEKYKTSHGKVHMAGRWTPLSDAVPDVHDLRSHIIRLGAALREEPLRVEPDHRAL